MYTVLFSERANKDIISIVEYVAADNPEAAEKLGSSLVERAWTEGPEGHKDKARSRNRRLAAWHCRLSPFARELWWLLKGISRPLAIGSPQPFSQFGNLFRLPASAFPPL
jgi:plasmid stabilization system protein ParE